MNLKFFTTAIKPQLHNLAISNKIHYYNNGDGTRLCVDCDLGWICLLWNDVVLALDEQIVSWYWCMFEFEGIIDLFSKRLVWCPIQQLQWRWHHLTSGWFCFHWIYYETVSCWLWMYIQPVRLSVLYWLGVYTLDLRWYISDVKHSFCTFMMSK